MGYCGTQLDTDYAGKILRKTVNTIIYWKKRKGKFVLFKHTSREPYFSYHRLLDIKHMVIMTYFFKGNLLSPHRLLFPISSKGSFICTFPQTRQHTPQPLVDHWFERKVAQTANAPPNVDSIQHLQLCALLPELCAAPQLYIGDNGERLWQTVEDN